MKMPTFIPIEDAAKRLGVSCESLRERVRDGSLEAETHDREVYVAEDDLADPLMLRLKTEWSRNLHRLVRRSIHEPIDSLALLREIRDDNEYDD